MTLEGFITKWLGKKADFDSAYGGQCVDLFRFYCKEVLSIPQPKGVVGAADFWGNYDTDPVLHTHFTKISNSPTAVPLPGDVVLWTRRAGGGFGHVAIFLEGDFNSFVSFDQNWPTLSVCTKTRHNYTNVYGWLRPKKTQPPREEHMDCSIVKHLNVKTEAEAIQVIEKEFAFLKSARIEVSDLQARVKDLEKEINNLIVEHRTALRMQEEMYELQKDELRKQIITPISTPEAPALSENRENVAILTLIRDVVALITGRKS